MPTCMPLILGELHGEAAKDTAKMAVSRAARLAGSHRHVNPDQLSLSLRRNVRSPIPRSFAALLRL